jgi:hypothetical protein
VVVNCRSVKNKVADFHHLIGSTDADVVIGTESWLSNEIADTEIFPKSYAIYRKDRTARTGGGVFIAVKDEFVSRAEIFPDNDLESVWCSIKCSTKRIFICSYYRPPDANINSVLELERQVKHFISQNTENDI